MVEVDTGSNTIFRFDKVMHPSICQYVTDYVNFIKQDQVLNKNMMPWEQGDNLNISGIFRIPDIAIKKALMHYNYLMCDVAKEKYGIEVVPEFMDIVLWRPGASHPEHWDNAEVTRTETIDNGDGTVTTKYFHEIENDPLRRRMFTTVLYLNEDYEGGETYINTENDTQYLSIPKTGSVTMFRSDFQNRHGVKEVLSGDRVTMSSWLGLDHPETSHRIYEKEINQILNSYV